MSDKKASPSGATGGLSVEDLRGATGGLLVEDLFNLPGFSEAPPPYEFPIRPPPPRKQRTHVAKKQLVDLPLESKNSEKSSSSDKVNDGQKHEDSARDAYAHKGARPKYRTSIPDANVHAYGDALQKSNGSTDEDIPDKVAVWLETEPDKLSQKSEASSFHKNDEVDDYIIETHIRTVPLARGADNAQYYRVYQPDVYQQTTIVINPISGLGPHPTTLDCPNCHHTVITLLEETAGTAAWLMSLACCLVGLWVGCCLLPCCAPGLQDVHHICPTCRFHVGTYRRME